MIIAYCPCVGHGYDLKKGSKQQKSAVLSGYWPLMRYHPGLKKQGKNPFQLDSKSPSIPLEEYIYEENRYRILTYSHPDVAKKFYKKAQRELSDRWQIYEKWAGSDSSKNEEEK